MNGNNLPPERTGFFLLVRRGVPITLGMAGILLALLEPRGRGWYLLVAMACLAEVWPTFRSGADYLRTRRASIRWDGAWVRAVRPLARLLGWEEAWILSFCAWNNRKLREHFQIHRARKVLVLLPHCIQASNCKAGIVADLWNCYSCGRCPAGDVLAKVLSANWNCRINNRSHKVYREAREFKPDLIVAVSCADRLLKGLTKLPQVPSYVIPLQLPHGMCVDTTFNLPHLAAAMEALVEADRKDNIQPLQVDVGA
jgi:uncharacterized protein